jgi:hypothetical protein
MSSSGTLVVCQSREQDASREDCRKTVKQSQSCCPLPLAEIAHGVVQGSLCERRGIG